MLKTFPKTHIAAAVVISAVVGTAMIFSPSAEVEAKRMSVSLDLESGEVVQTNLSNGDAPIPSAPATSDQESVASTEVASDQVPLAAASKTPTPADEPKQPELSWTEYQIKSGDTLSGLFKKAGFNDGLMLSVIHGEGEATKLQRLYAGERIAFATNQADELVSIKLQRSQLESLQIDKTGEEFIGKTVVKEPEVRARYAEGEIASSLFGAGQQAGLTDKLTMELAGIFGWDIDFVMDIRKGDRFSVVYEELYLDGEKIDDGKILAANFYNRSRELAAVFYTDKNGVSDYFTPDGRSMRKAFLRTPVDFARISSSFNLNRRHPVLNTIRAHKGTDYAARTGTPIKASGQGKVIHAGRKGGYGNAVILQHGTNITTLYAHMNQFAKGIRSGTYVKQGQVIGYVGSTGLATGPHLHYEFRVNGTHRNPATVKLPDAAPIAQAELERFKVSTDNLLAQLETYQESGRLTLARGE
ncbi:MAG: peptidoglycan DD-metalloendopeptidase family protein [Marinobacter sp.]|uniref:OapA family protein n=1 Tax=Marinobacter sp. TaxID=50741 RepID=UPI00349FF0BC